MTAHFLKIHRCQGNLTLAINGAFDAETVFHLRSGFPADQVQAGSVVVVDLSATDFMDSSGVGFLVSLLRRGQRDQWTIEIRGASGQSQRLLQRIGWPTTLAS